MAMLGTILCIVFSMLVIGLALAGAGFVLLGPALRHIAEQQRIEQERRLAEWRLAQATQAALQRMLDETRQSPS